MPKSNIARLLNTESPFFTLSSLQAILCISRESARTTASRLVERGILVRLRRDLYSIVGRKYSIFSLANALYQPSVISLETALNYWGLIVQVPQIIFSVGLGSHKCRVGDTEFVYRRMVPSLFRFGQVNKEDFFISEPEKAFLDTLYMKSKGLVELLPEDVDMDKLDEDLLKYYSRLYSKTVKNMIKFFREHSYEAR
jgi:predicted transcriptional regulator of viral defense system